MTLDNFRTIELIWDKANKSIIKTIKTASSDTTGRYLSVKILDGGQEVTLNNAKLQLYWEHPNFNTNGTDDFTTVDTKGKFTLTFSKEMLTNIGELTAHLILTLSDGKITSDGFTIEVIKGADDGVVVPSDSYGLIKKIDGKIEKGNVTLNDLTQEVKVAMTGGSVAVVGENAVGTENVKDSAVTQEKLALDIQRDKFAKLDQLAPPLTANLWRADANILTEIDGGLKVQSPQSNVYSRISAPLNSQLSTGDKILIRAKVKSLSSDAIRNRIMLRSGASGTIYLQTQYGIDETNVEKVYELQYTATQNTSNVNLMLDTIYPTSLAGRETEIYEVSALKIPAELSKLSVEEISKMTSYSDDAFNAGYILNSISQLNDSISTVNDKVNWDSHQDNRASFLEVVKSPNGEVETITTDKYSYPERLTWGNEYLHSYYVSLEDDNDIAMLVSGDSTTAGNQLLENYRRHNLIKEMLTKSGFPPEKLETFNLGHGENTTKNWLDTWLDEDMSLIQTKLDNNILPMYILGWGINDGGLNYNSGTTIQKRVDIFENSLKSGLAKLRNSYSADDVPVILATPVTTYDLNNKRNNDEWQNYIRDIIKKSAREYQCAFIDLGLYHYDRSYTTKWSAGGDKVHPNRYATKDYMSLFKDLLVPYLFEK